RGRARLRPRGYPAARPAGSLAKHARTTCIAAHSRTAQRTSPGAANTNVWMRFRHARPGGEFPILRSVAGTSALVGCFAGGRFAHRTDGTREHLPTISSFERLKDQHDLGAGVESSARSPNCLAPGGALTLSLSA